MLTDTLIEDPRWQSVDIETVAERAAMQTLRHLSLEPNKYEIAILACDDARIADLNTDFRNSATPTNVLSWPSAERASEKDGGHPKQPSVPMDAELGDIAISYDTCAREASAANTPMQDHVTHLIVHGTLHLLGYDHMRDLDATLMEQTEVLILGTLGLSSPY